MPTINTLNDAKCKAAKPPEKARKLFDGGGLYLFVSPTGAKTWRLAYRLDGKPKTKAFGPYPEVSLAAAREKRDTVKAMLRDGVDPMASKPVKASVTLLKASNKYWLGRKDISSSYRDNAMRGIEMHLGPKLGKRDMGTSRTVDPPPDSQRLTSASTAANRICPPFTGTANLVVSGPMVSSVTAEASTSVYSAPDLKANSQPADMTSRGTPSPTVRGHSSACVSVSRSPA